MPKAAIHKYCDSTPGKYEIGMAKKPRIAPPTGNVGLAKNSN